MIAVLAAVLNSDQSVHLADYERKEILDYPSVYFIGNKNDKKAATRDNSTNNYGYDDDRGDYIINFHDHLAYRYEIIDTRGKGSFGQVLHCRDHCTGQSVAIKIIRNKKRFHHQALVEIKILENLRKWVSDRWTLSELLFMLISYQGSGRETPCYQDDGEFLFPQSSLHRHGITQY